LGNPEKQLVVAQELWSRSPGTADAARWMENSLLHKIVKGEGAQEVIEFVDLALKEHRGIRSEFLVLKARAILQKRKTITDAERRVQVSDLLIEAFVCHKKSEDTFAFPDLGDVSFLDMDHSFSQYFSTVEREALKVRMQKAKKAKD